MGMGGKGAPSPDGSYVNPANPGTHKEQDPNNPWPGATHDVPNTPGAFQQAADATAWGNRPNQNTPFGSENWTQDPATGHWTHNVGLNGPLAGAAQGLEGQFANAWGSPLDNGAQARQHAEDALYGQAASRLDPMWGQREQQFSSGLANQGIDPNSKAGQQAYGSFGRDRNDAYQSAINSASMLGGQEASRQQGMDLQSRMAPLSGLQGLAGLSGMPGFQQGPSYLPAAIAQYQGELQKYGIGQQGKDSMMSGLFGLGGTLGGAAIRGGR